MGWAGTAAAVLGTLFAVNRIHQIEVPQVQNNASVQPQVTGHDLVKSTESLEPNSASMGAESSKKGGGSGKSSLLVPSESLYKPTTKTGGR